MKSVVIKPQRISYLYFFTKKQLDEQDNFIILLSDFYYDNHCGSFCFSIHVNHTIRRKHNDLYKTATHHRNLAFYIICCYFCHGDFRRHNSLNRFWLINDEWLNAFHLYQQFPEFKIHNHAMDLAGFKSIFWFEYSHRLLGRLIGLIFFFPMVFFFVKGWVSSGLKIKLIIMFILGGLQGLLGWYMVKSGLVNNPNVSQYRLVAHLGILIQVSLGISTLLLHVPIPLAASHQAGALILFTLIIFVAHQTRYSNN